jgi:hypothetical protein
VLKMESPIIQVAPARGSIYGYAQKCGFRNSQS